MYTFLCGPGEREAYTGHNHWMGADYSYLYCFTFYIIICRDPKYMVKEISKWEKHTQKWEGSGL